MSQALWSPHELLRWLEDHPCILEPGICFTDRPLDVEDRCRVPLAGVDPFGRPALVFFGDKLDAEFVDLVVTTVARFRGGSRVLRERFAAWGEPRVFIIAAEFEPDDLLRIGVLADAFPVQCHKLGFESGADGLLPVLQPVLIGESPGLEGLMLHQTERPPFAHRLLLALAALGIDALPTGADWPCRLQRDGSPCASLHCRDGRLTVCAEGERLVLEDERSVDAALDLLVRSSCDQLPSLPEEDEEIGSLGDSDRVLEACEPIDSPS